MANITIPGLPAKTGTILDAAYLHLNESSVDKKVTIAQLLAKIEAEYSADIVTFLGSANKAEGRANLSIDRRVTVDNANYTILATDKVVAQIGTMSAARTFSLPAASTVEAGSEIIVIDESGSVDSTNKIIVQRNGTDTIDSKTERTITSNYGSLRLISNGSNSWKEIVSNNNSGFRAYRNTNQTISTNTTTTMQIDTEAYDINNEYDNTTNYRFTPTIAGKYYFYVSCRIDALADGNRTVSNVVKNGSVVAQGQNYASTTPQSCSANCSIILDMNGTTDYVESAVFHDYGSNRNLSAAAAHNIFCGQLLMKS
jgi:hypothetical protein